MSASHRRAHRCACVLFTVLLATVSARATPPETARGRVERTHAAPLPDYVVRPIDGAPGRRPVALYLHGLCGDPGNGCGYFRAGVIERAWLVCPSAPVACPGHGATWATSGGSQRATLTRALADLARREPSGVDLGAPGVLIGFSQGAYVARDLLRAWRGRFTGVAFIGAYVAPTRAELEAAGVRRVVLAAGRRDGTHAALVTAAQRLEREGFPVRFLDLGPVGHTYAPAPGTPGWRDALAWLGGG